MTGPKTPDDLLDSADTISVETRAAVRPEGAEQDAAGQLISDKYRLLRQLGEGGMASVWVAPSSPGRGAWLWSDQMAHCRALADCALLAA